MSFDEKLNTIFNLLNCSNIEMAKVCEIDTSLVSRFRTGARIPGTASSQFSKLCSGIVAYAKEKFLWEKLKETCKISGTDEPEEGIRKYLMPQDMIQRSQPMKQTKTSYCPLFSEKLNALMNMFSISNIRLARVLNVDSSFISRLRNGLRTPHKNQQLIVNICTYFYRRVMAEGLEVEFSEILCIPLKMVENGGDELLAYFIDWISDKSYIQNTGSMDSLLEKIDSFSKKDLKLYEMGKIFDEVSKGDIVEYIGIEGFREAVIRFLSAVATSKETFHLKLYSDQNIEWMKTDPIFTQKWAALMYTVLLKKNHMQIIHNIDRRLPEMLIGIENWLPLYMTGMIEAFYSKRVSDARFANTLFIAPELAAVNANIVSGTENTGKYQYINTEKNIAYYESQYDALIKMSNPLIQVFNEQSIEKYHFRVNEMAKREGQTKKLLISLSIATMPKTLLEKILIRNEIPQIETDKFLKLQDASVKEFEKELQSGAVIEYVALPNEEILNLGEAKLNLSDLFSSQSIFYTKEEYSEHIYAIVSLLNNNDNYHFVPLSDSPFAHVQMAVKDGVGVMVLKSNTPSVAFWFEHQMMCQAFKEYLVVIHEKYSLRNKSSIADILNKYLQY